MNDVLDDVRALTYSRLSSSEPMCALRWFTPTDEFWKLLDRIVPPGVLLVDAGCGMGKLVEESQARGRRMLGIDIMPRDGQTPGIVSIQDAIRYGWSETTWPLICRPSHDGWCYDAAHQARRKGAHVLYVGLPKNYGRDMGRVRSKSYGVIGAEGERLYAVKPLQPWSALT